MSQDKVEAVERALRILDAFGTDHARMTLTEVAEATGFYKSTILRLAASLERFGYLIRDEDGTFRLGPALGRLGSVYRHGLNLGDAIRPELGKLVDATQETASFYVRENKMRVCLFRHNSPQAARHHLDEGAHLPLDAGAAGHVLRAFSDERGKLRDPKLDAVKERGHAVSLGERDPHVAAVAVPVFDIAGRLRGALAISGPISRFGDRERGKALTELLSSASRLGAILPAGE
jgi:DNA-binding IclR family transcriptional regulator